MSQGNIDLGFFHETEVIGGGFARESSGYCVAATAAPIPHRGGVVVFYREVQQFSLGALCLYGPNVVNFQPVMGQQR